MVKVATETADIPSTGLVIIDFFATWCGPCKKIAPFFEQLADEYAKITFLKVDVDESPELTEEYDVQVMPTFLFIKDGKVVKRVEGASVSEIESGFALMTSS